MSKPTIVLLAAALLAGASSSWYTSEAEEPTANAEASSTEVFPKGSIAMIIAKVPSGLEAKNMTYAIMNPELERIGNRWFVLGKPVKDPNKPAQQYVSSSGISWENVIEFSVFSRDQFTNFTEEMQANAER